MKEVLLKLIQKLSIKVCIVKLFFQKIPFFFGVFPFPRGFPGFPEVISTPEMRDRRRKNGEVCRSHRAHFCSESEPEGTGGFGFSPASETA